MAQTKIELNILTCEPRKDVLAQTLASLEASDWSGRVVVTKDSMATTAPDVYTRTMDAVKFILDDFLFRDTEAEYIMFCEDDVDYNKHIEHNLMQWFPIASGTLDMGSLYNPNIHMMHADDARHMGVAHPEAVYGTQTIILSRKAVKAVCDTWMNYDKYQPGMFQDILISRICSANGFPIYYHLPSLVEHRAVPSTYGGTKHQSIDFAPDFRR